MCITVYTAETEGVSECVCVCACVYVWSNSNLWQWKCKGCNLKTSLPFGHISRIIYNTWLFNFLFPFFFFLLDCIVDSDNELFILYSHHRGRRRLTSSFRHNCGTLNAKQLLANYPQKHTLLKKKKKKMWISCSIPSMFTFAQKRCDHWKRCHPRQWRAPQRLARERWNLKKKNHRTNRDSVQGSKGNQREKCCFLFFFLSLLKGELGVDKMDGCYGFLFLFTDGWDVM